MKGRNVLLLGKTEEIDLVQPQVREMLACEGFYLGSDTKAPGMNVPLVVMDGRVYSMTIDQELPPDRFKETLTLRGPFFAKDGVHE